MGCGGSGSFYTEEDLDEFQKKNQMRFPSAELTDEEKIKLKSHEGFFNSQSLLDTRWFQGRLTNDQYRQSIEHINNRVAQTKIGQMKTMSMGDISTFQSTKLALQELNDKFNGKVLFSYQSDGDQSAFILIDFP